MSGVFEQALKTDNESCNSIQMAFSSSGIDVMEEGEYVNGSAWIWPASDMDFWKIDNKVTSVKIKWSHNCFEDYKTLSYQFYKCGYKTFEEVIGSGHDNIKSDMWFLTGIFLVRHSIELGLKALLCRVLPRKRDIEDAFEACCHDVSMLFHKYTDVRLENYLTEEEEDWLIRYLDSLEEVDKKSDMFRFPFEDEFLSKYRDKFLDNVDVANNMLQGYALVKKCIDRGIVTEEDEFDEKLKPEFFVFASHGIGNCYLWQRISDEGFHVKVTGYSEVIDYIYQNQNITNEDKLYPLFFMFRNTIELCLKRLFYSRVDNGVPLKVFNSKRKSHLIKKDLWKNVKPVIKKYANDSGEDLTTIDIVEGLLEEINELDKNGDNFRYPTSYSLEYRFDNKELDISNVYSLSVLENSSFYGDHKKDYWRHKAGKKTHRDYLREDVEYCLSFATSPREFESQLYALGYTLDPVRFSVKAKHWERSVRLANIGFTKEIVQAQLDRNAESRYHLFTLEYRPPYKPKKFPLEDEMRKLEFAIDHSYDTATVFVDTIFYIIITIIQIAAELADVMLLSPDLRASEKDLKELISDYHFLKENDIHSVADLQANIDENKAQLSNLERERKDLSNRIRRPKSPEDENQNKESRKAISKQMKPVRERLRRAEKILEKSPHLYELLKQEHELERKARARYLDRSRLK